ncbi:MAG: type IV pilus assembly protein PilM [Deltaproteobacteria bacterium]|nr:type IV pilus assembly protein PilM [Deltaproteobacteria bacterium]
MELPFFKKTDVVGLDIGSNSIKIIQLAPTKKGWKMIKIGMSQLPPEAIVDGSIIDSMTVINSVKDLIGQQEIKIKNTVSALTGHSVIIKKVNLPVMTEAELAESIQWEAEQYIPFPITDVNIDFQILGADTEGRGQMEVMLVAVKKDVINDYINVIKEAGLVPVIVDVDSFALENMFEMNYSIAPNENIAMINIGATIASINVLRNGITIFTRAIPLGGNQFTEEIQKTLGISFKDAETLKLGGEASGVDTSSIPQVVERVSGNVALEIKRSVDFFLGGAPGMFVSKIYLSGGCTKTKGLPAIIQDRTAIPLEVVNPFTNIECNPKKFAPDYISDVAPYFGIGVGLAVRKVGDK